jgi:hypothetical protein
MSVGKQALKYTAAAIAVAAIIIVSSTLYLGVNLGATTTTGASGAQGGTPAQLAIQLTDPPTVPTGTSLRAGPRHSTCSTFRTYPRP